MRKSPWTEQGRRRAAKPITRDVTWGLELTAYRNFYAACAALSFVCAGGVAQAQSLGDSIASGPVSYNFARDRNVSVRQRPRADYEALGGHMGGFMVFPRVLGTVEHDDNIYALATNELSDTVYRVQPEVSLNSNWSRHALNLYARSTLTRYDEHGTEDSDQWTVGGSGRLDILRTETLSGSFDIARLTEPRTDTSNQNASVVPVQYYQRQAELSFVREFNRVRVSTRGDWRQYDYRDGRAFNGASVDQDDRDRNEYSLTVRGEYAVSPATAMFVEVSGNKHDYDLSDAEIKLSRDSDGFEIRGGANFELSNLLRGEVSAGYLEQAFDDPLFRDIHGFGARAQVEWFPTQLTTVTFTGSRQIQDSGIPGSAGYLSTNVAAQVDHELLRNLILTAQVAYGDDDYKDIDRTDKNWRAGLSGTYLLNRNVGLTVGYSYYDQNSSGVDRGAGYTINKFGATMTLQY